MPADTPMVLVPLKGAPYPRSFLDDLNGYATGGSTRCREALIEHGVTLSAPSTTSTAEQVGAALAPYLEDLKGIREEMAKPDTPSPGEGDAPVAEQAAKLAAIISDDEVARVHGHANFGSQSPREVVNDGVRKYAVGYTSGHTQLCILLEHGLITKPRPGRYDASLTKKGKRYARVLFADAFTRPTPATREGLREAVRKVGLWMKCGMPDQSDDTPRRDALRRDLQTILAALQPQAQPAALSPETER